MCKAQDHSSKVTHSVIKDVGEINNSSGFHFVEFHIQSVGVGALLLLGAIVAVYALYRVYKNYNRNNNSSSPLSTGDRNRDRNRALALRELERERDQQSFGRDYPSSFPMFSPFQHSQQSFYPHPQQHFRSAYPPTMGFDHHQAAYAPQRQFMDVTAPPAPVNFPLALAQGNYPLALAPASPPAPVPAPSAPTPPAVVATRTNNNRRFLSPGFNSL